MGVELVGRGSGGEIEEVLVSVGGGLHGMGVGPTGLLIKLPASMRHWESSSGEWLFKLDLEPPDVAERVFVELEVEGFAEHVHGGSLEREGRFLGFLGNDSVFCLHLLVSGLCFVGVNSVE